MLTRTLEHSVLSQLWPSRDPGLLEVDHTVHSPEASPGPLGMVALAEIRKAHTPLLRDLETSRS